MLIEKIIKIKRRREFYHNSIVKGIKRKRIFYIFVYSFIFIVSFLNILNLVSLPFKINPLWKFAIPLFSLGIIIISIRIILVDKIVENKNYTKMSKKELKKELASVKKEENNLYKYSNKKIANTFYYLLLSITILFIFLYKNYTNTLFEIKSIKIETIFIIFTSYTFIIGNIISNPKTPIKYKKEQVKFLNIIKFTVYDNFTNSTLNPMK